MTSINRLINGSYFNEHCKDCYARLGCPFTQGVGPNAIIFGVKCASELSRSECKNLEQFQLISELNYD